MDPSQGPFDADSTSEPAVVHVGEAGLAQLVVLTGPIASGKSTIAARLATRLLEAGQSGAVVDLDDVADCLYQPPEGAGQAWVRARWAHDHLVSAFRRSGVDVVIAHGSLFYERERMPTPDGVSDKGALRVLLTVPFEVARGRVTADPTRALSRDPDFLRATHQAFARRRPTLPRFDHEFDTSRTDVEDVVTTLAGALLARS